ncbi:MAG: alkaline phosphatase D family protein [Gemmatimonadaceae bacterium]|nr:alkaline phosphatase D family protein [Gemmatimonadaceae bacterium]
MNESDERPSASPSAAHTIDRRQFVAASVAFGATALLPFDRACAEAGSVRVQEDYANTVLGPILGHVDDTSAMVWMRIPTAGVYRLELFDDGPLRAPTSSQRGRTTRAAARTPAAQLRATAEAASDYCVHWHVKGLRPAARYTYRVVHAETGAEVAAHAAQQLSTAYSNGTPSKVRFAISSCALEDAGSRAIWSQMAAQQCDAVVLLGDTPYIDSTALAVQTTRHRAFAAVPEYQALLRSTPCWWTWDDHDFAGNDASGQSVGKENSRTVFQRYRPQPTYGGSDGGIYTSFRRGPLEVFLLDTRWFSMTGPSWADPVKPTFLGRGQWEWLKAGLRASTAPFKLLACGVIWDNKENTEADHWGTYAHERRAIERFLGEERISGVILAGGDIHASRVLRYASTSVVGYDLAQFIASPIHGNTIASLNVYHPRLVRSAVEPHVFLRVDVDNTISPARFDAALINRRGETVFSYGLSSAELSRPS